MRIRRRFVAAAAAAVLAGGGIAFTTACEAPSCPEGTVSEYDDDGYECEPDEDGNGIDDEDQDDD